MMKHSTLVLLYALIAAMPLCHAQSNDLEPDEKHFASSEHEDSSIKKWNIHSGDCINLAEGLTTTVTRASFSADCESIFIIGDFQFEGFSQSQYIETSIGNYRVILIHPDELKASLIPHHRNEISQDGLSVLSISKLHRSYSLPSRSIRSLSLLNTITGEAAQTYGDDSINVYKAYFSPDNSLVISGDENGILRIYDSKTAEELRTINLGKISSIELSPDMKRLLISVEDVEQGTGDINGVSKLYDLDTEELLHTFQGIVPAFSSDGKRVATGDSSILKIWDAESGALLQEKEAHPGYMYYDIRHIKFSPDGSLLLTSGGEGSAKLWNVNTFEIIRTIGPYDIRVQSIDFSPDSKKMLIAHGNGLVQLWNINNLQSMIQNFELYN